MSIAIIVSGVAIIVLAALVMATRGKPWAVIGLIIAYMANAYLNLQAHDTTHLTNQAILIAIMPTILLCTLAGLGIGLAFQKRSTKQ